MDLFTFPVQEMLETQDKGNLEENAEKVSGTLVQQVRMQLVLSSRFDCFSQILTMIRNSEIIKRMGEQEEKCRESVLRDRSEVRVRLRIFIKPPNCAVKCWSRLLPAAIPFSEFGIGWDPNFAAL